MNIDKLNKLIQKKLSEKLIKEIKLNNNMITITNILISKNISLCKIFVTIMYNELKIINMLNKSSYKFKKYLSRSIKIYKIPKLIFLVDEKVKDNINVNKLIDKINKKND